MKPNKQRTPDTFTRAWILKTGIPIVKEYGGNITLRALHYRLVAAGMHNTIRHYKRVVQDGKVHFSAFKDHERDVEGMTYSSPDGARHGFECLKDFNKKYTTLYRIGKKAAGRLLDGVYHNQFPETTKPQHA